MPIIRITDADDRRIADYRNVPDPELLRRRGLFVAENRLVVRALLASARFRTQSVLVTDAAYDALRDDLAPREDVLPIYVCAKSLMEPVAGYNIHRGCLALGERPAPVSVRDLLAALPCARRREGAEWGVGAPRATELGGVQGSPPFKIVVLEAITNADNVGTVFRNARAFGVDAVVVGPRCCDPLYRKAIRVSIGAALEVPFAISGGAMDTPDCSSAGLQARDSSAVARPADARWASDLDQLKRSGFTLVALTPAHDALDLNRFAAGPLPKKMALLVGNEGEGLSAEVQRAADVRVRIAMAPGVDSLNVSTATGIALHRLWSRESE